MLFSDLDTVLRTLVTGTLAYAALILLLRVSGKRTLSKWNAFDLVVTVAFGSTLATALLSQTTSVVQAATAFATLIALQFIVTSLSVRWRRIERLVKARPTLLFHDGEFISAAMTRERVSHAEVLAALRGAGIGDAREAAAVVLETDGSFSVIASGKAGDGSALADVERPA